MTTEVYNTYNVSASVLKRNRDYCIDALIEAPSIDMAAIIFVRDWIKEFHLWIGEEFIVVVSEPNGNIHPFRVKNNMCTPMRD